MFDFILIRKTLYIGIRFVKKKSKIKKFTIVLVLIYRYVFFKHPNIHLSLSFAILVYMKHKLRPTVALYLK